MNADAESRAKRLIQARIAAGFRSASEAAKQCGWRVSTYCSHENGSRGINPLEAKKYAKDYNVSYPWLMTGVGIANSPGIDAELLELDPEDSEKLIEAFRILIQTVRRRRSS